MMDPQAYIEEHRAEIIEQAKTKLRSMGWKEGERGVILVMVEAPGTRITVEVTMGSEEVKVWHVERDGATVT